MKHHKTREILAIKTKEKMLRKADKVAQHTFQNLEEKYSWMLDLEAAACEEMGCTEVQYSWIDHGLQSGHTLGFLLWLSNFKTKTSFGFLIKEVRGRFFIFLKSRKINSYDQKRCFWRL